MNLSKIKKNRNLKKLKYLMWKNQNVFENKNNNKHKRHNKYNQPNKKKNKKMSKKAMFRFNNKRKRL